MEHRGRESFIDGDGGRNHRRVVVALWFVSSYIAGPLKRRRCGATSCTGTIPATSHHAIAGTLDTRDSFRASSRRHRRKGLLPSMTCETESCVVFAGDFVAGIRKCSSSRGLFLGDRDGRELTWWGNHRRAPAARARCLLFSGAHPALGGIARRMDWGRARGGTRWSAESWVAAMVHGIRPGLGQLLSTLRRFLARCFKNAKRDAESRRRLTLDARYTILTSRVRRLGVAIRNFGWPPQEWEPFMALGALLC